MVGRAVSEYNVLELCALAGERLKRAGFEVASVSMKSEAVYYRFVGLEKLLRVSTHTYKGSPIGLPNVVAWLTFNGGRRNPRTLTRSSDGIDNMIWMAIGQYFDREPRPSRYQGKNQPTDAGREALSR